MTILSQIPILIFLVQIFILIKINSLENPYEKIKRIVLIIFVFSYIAASSVTSLVEYSRWNSGYASNEGFTYWSYHDLIIGDISNATTSNTYEIILNDTLSDWDKYLVTNLAFRTLIGQNKSRCLNCHLRNNEVTIEERPNLSEINNSHNPSCLLESRVRLVGICPIKKDLPKR